MTRRNEQLMKQVDIASQQLREIYPLMPELERRLRFAVRDGYPSASMGGSGGSSEISRPTENTAIADPARDTTGDTIRQAYQSLSLAIESASAAFNAAMYAISLGEGERGRVSLLTECKACHETVTGVGNSRIKGAGYCHNCYAVFVRYRNNLPTTEAVDHAAFEKGRREYLASKSEAVAS